jgi:hypothetical protein
VQSAQRSSSFACPLKPLKDEGALERLGAVCLALRLNN